MLAGKPSQSTGKITNNYLKKLKLATALLHSSNLSSKTFWLVSQVYKALTLHQRIGILGDYFTSRFHHFFSFCPTKTMYFAQCLFTRQYGGTKLERMRRISFVFYLRSRDNPLKTLLCYQKKMFSVRGPFVGKFFCSF